MSSVLVSIVIPTYNRANYIGRTIQSAIDQTFEACEIIVCDNNSQDNTEEMVNDFIAKYPSKKIKYIKHPQNIGPVRNWFSGIHEASGKYIKILFSDDILYPNSVRDLYDKLDKSNYAFSYGKVDNLWQNSSVSSFVRYRPGHEVTVEEYIASFFCQYLSYETYPVSPCAALLRKEVLLQIPLEEFSNCVEYNTVDSGIGPDMMMFLYSFALFSPSAIYVNKKVAAFEGHNTSITITSGMEKLDNNNFAAFLKFYHLIKQKDSPVAKVIEKYFDRMASLPNYFRRPAQRMDLLAKSGYYKCIEKRGFIPLAGFAFYFMQKVQYSAEFRIRKYFRGLNVNRNYINE